MNEAIIRVAADGSPGSRRALDWALAEAAVRGCAVELVSAYPPGPPETREDRRAAAEAAIHATMDPVVSGSRPSAPVSWHVVEGPPADVLIRESEHSSLLVMGSHGVTGLVHSALGSVSDLCARMAACPVVIIPAGYGARSDEDLPAVSG